jgi:hypothetical protein
MEASIPEWISRQATEPTCVAIGYLNDDAYPDLAIANSTDIPAVSSILSATAMEPSRRGPNAMCSKHRFPWPSPM